MESKAVPASGVSVEDHAEIMKQAVSREAMDVAREICLSCFYDGELQLNLLAHAIQTEREAYAADCVARDVAGLLKTVEKAKAVIVEACRYSVVKTSYNFKPMIEELDAALTRHTKQVGV